jgi:hypothetical protein
MLHNPQTIIMVLRQPAMPRESADVNPFQGTCNPHMATNLKASILFRSAAKIHSLDRQQIDLIWSLLALAALGLASSS